MWQIAVVIAFFALGVSWFWLTILIMLLVTWRRLAYFFSFGGFYWFSGAHDKPSSDKQYDPALRHARHPFHRAVRWLEGQETAPVSRVPVWPCPQVTGPVDEAAFRLLTNRKTTPLVIRGALANSVAVQHWTPESLKQRCGDAQVLVLGKGEALSLDQRAYKSFNQKLEMRSVTLAEAVDHMCSGAQDEDPLYINNVTSLFRERPYLVEELGMDEIEELESDVSAESWLKVNLFMGGQHTGSSLHCAVAGNFFCNVYGKKRWALIPPRFAKHLKPTPSRNFEFAISGDDYEHPSDTLNNLPRYEVELEPGDLLYVPPWWWHYVENTTPFTIGCAVRDHTAYWQSFVNQPTYMLLSSYWWKLHPWTLLLLNLYYGRRKLVDYSMDSDKAIVNNLTE